ncbi:MAG: SIS domain-containing protein [Oscillospiraceae bacterium]|jgi:glucosamine 6-phosphate synthetase-like amidotransferase/phosphosugar isomerase protein
MNKSAWDNMLRREVMSLPELGTHLLNDNIETTPDYGGIRLALSTPDLEKAKKVILTGCGDSYCAAVAGARAFRLLGKGVDAVSMPIVEYTREYPSSLIGTEPQNPLVYIISKSGGPSRCREAAKRTNEVNLGGLSVAVTATPDSPLAKECRRIVQVDVPDLENEFNEAIPGCRSYYASIYAVFSQAIRMGEVKGVYPMSLASKMRNATQEYAAAVIENIEPVDEQMFELANEWKKLDTFEFVSSGADMATAWFSAAKIYEATGDFATYENAEEFCHINYFADKPKNIGTVFMINSGDPSYPRFKGSVEASVGLGRPTLVVTDAPKEDFPEGAIVCTLPSPKFYWEMPIAHYVPVCLFAGYLAKAKDVAMFRTDLPKIFKPDGNQLRSSAVKVVK